MKGRRKTVRIPEKQLKAQRSDIGRRMAYLVDRYHAMHVLHLEMDYQWRCKPWWKRLWLRLTGNVPDIDAVREERMAELDAMISGPCPHHKHGVRCQHPDGEGHEGLHKRRSFGDQIVEWTDEESDGADGGDG